MVLTQLLMRLQCCVVLHAQTGLLTEAFGKVHIRHKRPLLLANMPHPCSDLVEFTHNCMLSQTTAHFSYSIDAEIKRNAPPESCLVSTRMSVAGAS